MVNSYVVYMIVYCSSYDSVVCMEDLVAEIGHVRILLIVFLVLNGPLFRSHSADAWENQ